eukprot:PhF_6_TR29076/c0_g1_i5/m.42382
MTDVHNPNRIVGMKPCAIIVEHNYNRCIKSTSVCSSTSSSSASSNHSRAISEVSKGTTTPQAAAAALLPVLQSVESTMLPHNMPPPFCETAQPTATKLLKPQPPTNQANDVEKALLLSNSLKAMHRMLLKHIQGEVHRMERNVGVMLQGRYFRKWSMFAFWCRMTQANEKAEYDNKVLVHRASQTKSSPAIYQSL